ncbi:MAG: (2Fe-2S)-binding protein [Bdellovibrionales bacterium]|nr:(2Fe-2S)-binding protein [Bdellovibrionales bacterium]
MDNFKVKIVPSNIYLKFCKESYLLDILQNHKIEISHSCGGMGTCGTCRVIVQSEVEKLPPRNEVEQEMAVDRGFSAEERLSCQLYVKEDLEIKIP